MGVLQNLIDAYKFERAKAGADALASLLDMHLPLLPAETVVVAMPTLSAHIRVRGYDHTSLIARRFARMRGLTFGAVLVRHTDSVQRGASKQDRFRQAEATYGTNGSIAQDRPYLLLDDIVTTNASLKYAAKALLDAGASDVWVAVCARQPLDKSS